MMSSTPLGPMAVGMMIGIVAAEHGALGLAASVGLVVGATAAAISATLRAKASWFIVLAAACAAGVALHWSLVRCTEASSIGRLVASGPSVVRVRGQINSQPTIPKPNESIFGPWQYQGEQTSFLLRVAEMKGNSGWRAESGLIKVTIREAVLDVAEGDRVELFGRLTTLRGPQNPGEFDWRRYYRQQGVAARLYCDQRENVVLLGRDGSGFLSWVRAKARGFLTDDIAAAAAEEASLLEAMVLGHRSRFDRRLNEIFTRAGCVHFIAASGTNIVILMGALWLVGRLAGLDQRACAWLMIAGIALYGLVAEARPPILRACIMGTLFCLAILFQRAPSHLNWICAAAVILCLIDPLTVFDVGFQLSFAAVLGVAYLAPAVLHACESAYWGVREVALGDRYARADRHLRRVAEKFAPLSKSQRAGRWIGRLCRATAFVCAVSLGAWLITAPITASWFQQVQPWGVISSVLVYPLMSLVMVLGLSKAVIAILSPALAGMLTWMLGIIDGVMIWLVEKMSSLPGATPTVAAPPWWVVTAYYFLLIVVIIAYRSQKRQLPDELTAEKKPGLLARRHWLAVLSILPFVAGSVAWRNGEARPKELRMTTLSVGAGLAVVLELPNGQTVLYDAGSSALASVGEKVILPFLRQRGIRAIDRTYVSHPDLDHFSGIPELISEVPTGPILVNECFNQLARPRSPAVRLIEHLREKNHPLERIDHSDNLHSNVRVEWLWPDKAACANLTANDSSTVLKVSYAGRSILLTGDISERGEQVLTKQGNLRADVLLVPHHGSVCSKTAEFLRSVGAGILVRSSHEPDAETMNGLLDLAGGAEMYNTADCGAVTVIVSEAGVKVETWLDCK